MPASGERFCAASPLAARSAPFDRLPVCQHFVCAAHLCVAEDVRVAADELVHDAGDYVGQTETPFLGRDLREQRDLQQQVAQLLRHFFGVVRVQCVKQFVSFLQHRGAHLPR